ncbi:hypothetical protein THAOC_29561, partial [Thalassiosira oceanica]
MQARIHRRCIPPVADMDGLGRTSMRRRYRWSIAAKRPSPATHHSCSPGEMNNRRWTATSSAALLLLVVVAVMTGRDMADAFVALSPVTRSVSSITRARRCSSSLHAQISEKEANVAINNVVKALQKDREANEELGRLQKVNNVLGYGSPKPGTIAVRFNASFRKAGKGLSSVPLPF